MASLRPVGALSRQDNAKGRRSIRHSGPKDQPASDRSTEPIPARSVTRRRQASGDAPQRIQKLHKTDDQSQGFRCRMAVARDVTDPEAGGYSLCPYLARLRLGWEPSWTMRRRAIQTIVTLVAGKACQLTRLDTKNYRTLSFAEFY